MELKTKKKIMNFIAKILGIEKDWNEPKTTGGCGQPDPMFLKRSLEIVDLWGEVRIKREEAIKYTPEELNFRQAREISGNIIRQLQELGMVECTRNLKSETDCVVEYRLRVVKPESK